MKFLQGGGGGKPSIDFEKSGGLAPVVVVDVSTRQVLMVGYADRAALERTVETGYAHFYSRSRQRIWMKGETSGNRIRVVRVSYDCDADTILYYGIPEGPACHTGRYSCFYRDVLDSRLKFMWDMIVEAFRSARIHVRRGFGGLEEYLYIVNPLSDNIPPPSQKLQALIADYLSEGVEWGSIDKVVAPESLGLPIASLVAERLGAPLAVVRKRRYPESGIEAGFTSGYEEGRHYIYGVEPGESVVIADDTVSTGGAAASIIEALRGVGVEVKAVLASMAKPQYGGLERLARLGVGVRRAVDVYVSKEGKVRLVQPETSWEVELKVPVTE